MNRDGDQLRLLSIFHYVVAGIMGLFSLFPIIYVIMGHMIMEGKFPMGPAHAQANPTTPPPAWLGTYLMAIGVTGIVLGLTMTILTAVAGHFVGRQRHYTFCFVVAAIGCIFFPFGTVLGVFTILVLMRPSVKDLFERNTIGTTQ